MNTISGDTTSQEKKCTAGSRYVVLAELEVRLEGNLGSWFLASAMWILGTALGWSGFRASLTHLLKNCSLPILGIDWKSSKVKEMSLGVTCGPRKTSDEVPSSVLWRRGTGGAVGGLLNADPQLPLSA